MPQLTGSFAIAKRVFHMSQLESAVKEIAEEMRQRPDRGEVATYIPELARADPNAFGLAVVDADGNVVYAGDADTPFSIQSVSKVFTLTIALGMVGDRLWNRVGREPSGSAFNSIVQLERERGIPRNPFINAGAIAVTDVILSGHQPREALGEILRFMQFLADDASITIDKAVAASENRTGFRNRALANYMKSFGVIEEPGRIHAWRLFPPLRDRDVVSAIGDGRPVSRLPRPQSIDGSIGRSAGPGPPHQRHHAHMRALRRFGRVRLSRRSAGEERCRVAAFSPLRQARRRSLSGRQVSMPRAIRIWVGLRSKS